MFSTRAGGRVIYVAIAVASVLALGFFFIIGNPLNLGVEKSHNFSVERFETIAQGQAIKEAIDLLGDPVRVEHEPEGSVDCAGCSYYYFMGNPSRWLVSYREAWIIVGPDGVIKQTILHSEP